MIIERETPADDSAIRHVHLDVFPAAEADLVEHLRKDGDVLISPYAGPHLMLLMLNNKTSFERSGRVEYASAFSLLD